MLSRSMMRKFVTTLCTLTLVFAVACGGGKEVAGDEEGEDEVEEIAATDTAGTATAAPVAAVSADAATISGTVKFEGTAGKMGNVAMSADPFCQSQHKTPVVDEEVVVSATGELANVLVYVKNAPAGAPNMTPALLDQKGCQYTPHVSAVQVGQPVQIRNSDNTLHNVHAMPEINSQFNEGQPVPMTATKKFDKVELKPFRIKCDVHGWMKSYMAVLPHSFHSVSQMNGTFSIGNLPPGNYTLVAWHEKYGQQEQQVAVGAKETKAVAFTFRG